MRICKVWDSEYPWDVRVEKVARSLTAAGHEVHLVARNRDRRSERERLSEADVHRLKPWRMLGKRLDRATMFPAFFNPRWAGAVMRTARENNAQLVLVRDLPLAPTAIWAARRLGIPAVLDMAENYPAMMRGLWETGVNKPADFFVRNPWATAAVERWVLDRIDHILVVVDESRDRLIDLGVSHDRITVVSNTPSVSRLKELSAKTHEDNGPLELIYLGLLEAPRGIAVLIDAIALARKAGVAANLTILGDGRERRNFEERARSLGLDEETVRFRGRVPYAEALHLLQRADVGVVPHVANESWNTTVPNKLFDYMAGGLAVLTSSTKPVARIVRESEVGLVYQDGSAEDCASAIGNLKPSAFRARCGANGRQAVLKRFNWERDSALMLGALDRVVAGQA